MGLMTRFHFDMRVCSVCKELKSAFYKGYAQCTDCRCARVRLYRQLNNSVRLYDIRRAKLPHRKLKVKKAIRRIRLADPLKYKAQTAVSNAVRDGRLTKPQNCSECGKQKRLTGHHDDYTKPLEVRWLCYRCHAIHHHSKDKLIMANKKKDSKVTNIKDATTTDCCKEAAVPTVTIPAQFNEIPTTVLGMSQETMRTLSLLASAIIFQSPAYATQANPTNIISLGDMFYRYALGSIAVQQPGDVVKGAAEEAVNSTTTPHSFG